MSVHYEINNQFHLSVGYNKTIDSFYGILLDNKPDRKKPGEAASDILVWVGTKSEPVRTVEELADILDPWTTLELDTVNTLSDIAYEAELERGAKRMPRLTY